MTPAPELLAAAAAIFGVLALVFAWLLRAQQRIDRQLTALKSAQEADQSSLLLQRQVEALREQVGRSLEATTGHLQQHLSQVASSVGARLQENTSSMQEGQAQLAQRLDHAAALAGTLQRSLGSLEEANRRIYDVGKDIASLQQILQAPKLRGGLGELLLENLLEQVLPRENFSLQHAFRNGHKVDAVIRLGSGIIPIDSKFPLENFRRLLDATTDDDRLRHRRAFVVDVKRHVDSVATKYILPNEGTFDFALMYVPAENVYFEIVAGTTDSTPEIQSYALSRKIIPVSPGSFYAYLQAIALGLRGMRIEERAAEILKQLAQMHGDFDRFRNDFRLLGKHLTNAGNVFESADRRLERFDSRLLGLVGSAESERVEGASIPQASTESLPGDE